MRSNLEHVSTKQQRIAELARTRPELVFTSLAHHIDLAWLEEAYRRTRKDGAAGIDRVTHEVYAGNLQENLRNLLERLRSGTYKAPPVRRKHIPKGTSGETRPIGIPTFEDKIAQRAVVMFMEPIYEQDFFDGSYGFRPNRGAHQALQSVWDATMEMFGGWVLEVNLRKFFDTLDHGHLRKFVSRRVRDGVLRRLIGQHAADSPRSASILIIRSTLLRSIVDASWLTGWRQRPTGAGSSVDAVASIHPSRLRDPQGGVISPLLANIYLHYVLDEWFEQIVKPLMAGKCRLIRYADDFVIVFQKKHDADRVMAVLSKRFEKYGLSVHPEKTKRIDFRSPNSFERRRENESRGDTKANRPETFDLLGITHYWGKTRKGGWAVRRKTMRSRLARAVQSIHQWCRDHRHWPVKEQWRKLSEKVRGHYAYYGITDNWRSISAFHALVLRSWRFWLNRRNNSRSMKWSVFLRLLKRYPLPEPKIVHSVFRTQRKVDTQ